MADITLGMILHTSANEPLSTTSGGLHVHLTDASGNTLLTSGNQGYIDVVSAIPAGSNRIGKISIEDTSGHELDINSSGVASVQEVGSTALGHGEKDVTTGGSAVQLPSNSCREVTIIPKISNSGNIYIGNSGVSSSSFGYYLKHEGKDEKTLNVQNTNQIFIDADNDGEGVRFIYG